MAHSEEVSATVVMTSTDDPTGFLGFIADLRDRTSVAEPVAWNASSWNGVDPKPLHHLCPPTGPSPADPVGRWRTEHRFGLCYYRRGPGFVIVYDRRAAASCPESLLDDPVELALFDRLSSPGAIAHDEPGASRLHELNLLLEVGGLAVALPYRERRLAMPTSVL